MNPAKCELCGGTGKRRIQGYTGDYLISCNCKPAETPEPCDMCGGEKYIMQGSQTIPCIDCNPEAFKPETTGNECDHSINNGKFKVAIGICEKCGQDVTKPKPAEGEKEWADRKADQTLKLAENIYSSSYKNREGYKNHKSKAECIVLCFSDALRQARLDALEDAAKVAESTCWASDSNDCKCPEIYSAIRKLKGDL